MRQIHFRSGHAPSWTQARELMTLSQTS